MAGKIIADIIESAGSQISLNVGNVTILTASSSGLTLTPTNNVNINVANSNVTFTTANVTGVATFSAGSNTAPSITTAGDTNTGIFFPAADTIGFAEGGVEAMRIDSSGNVGIGTSSPVAASLLTLKKTSAGGDGAELRLINSSTTVETATQIVFTNSTTDSVNAAVIKVARTSGGQDFRFVSDALERMRILSTGELLVATTTSFGVGVTIYTPDSGGSYSNTSSTATRNHFRFANPNGAIGSIQTTSSTTAYNTSSDYRLKENIAPMTGALAKVALLKPCTYKWKIDGSDGQGFIAHELDEVVSGCVTGEKDAVREEQYEVTPAVKDADDNTITEAVMGTRTVPVYQGIDTSFLVATLTAAIQELKVIVDAQAVEIAALKAK